MEEFFHGTGFFPTDGGGCCLVGQVKLLVLRCDAGGCLLIDSGVQLVRFGFLPYCDGWVSFSFCRLLLLAAWWSGFLGCWIWFCCCWRCVLEYLGFDGSHPSLRREEMMLDRVDRRLMLMSRESLAVIQRLESVFRFGSGRLVV